MSLIDNYKIITVTHHHVNVGDIGNFYLKSSEDQRFTRLQELSSAFNFKEIVYLETCNRVSYIIFGDFQISNKFLKSFFKEVNSDLPNETLNAINQFVSAYEGEKAINHVYELASSMDSLVVGEREIFRQLRSAFDKCKQNKLTGDYLRLLERAIVSTAKDIYSSTKIGEKSLSIVSLAIQQMLRLNKSVNQKVLLVGAGETNSLVGKFLDKYNFKNLAIYNRSLNNAQELSSRLNAPSFHLNELDKVAGNFDVIIICTSANQVVIDEALYQKMLKGDTNKKIIIDLAVPRNICPDVVKNYNVDYIDINSLKAISEDNLKFRQKEVELAKPILRKHLKNFRVLFQQRHIEKALSIVPKEIKIIKEKAISKVYAKRIDNLDEEAQGLLLEMMDYMEKKCVSIPMKAASQNLQY
ncbi:MAG: glutamyl-tRNA reductase [Saprospiraceae bacterium]|nr:glutamyl-tRNA reductase [Bacteroidia bacterium]NNE14222.1 glutamyl-tRNA reductase [Saprospiraceae bacterium]NNL91671.1 glutamyl-tRNA reductase [Saprospiraceae bacterium]